MDAVTYAAAKSYTNTKAQEVISALSGGLRYKGAVNYYSDLPASPEAGDAYTVKYKGSSGTDTDGTEYGWGTYEGTAQWIPIGPDVSAKANLSTLSSFYSSTSTYAVGDYCTHDGSLYRCNTAITTAEAWTAAHWTELTIGAEFISLKNSITQQIPRSAQTAKTAAMTQEVGVDNNGKIWITPPSYIQGTVKQTIGYSTSDTMSQAAITGVFDDKTAFYTNLFNKNDVESGYRWNATPQGVSKVATSGWSVLNHTIRLKANTVYFVVGFWVSADWTPFYDVNGNYDKTKSFVTIEALTGQWHAKWTVGNVDCYINASVDNNYLNVAYISEYCDYHTDYGIYDYSFKSGKNTTDISTLNTRFDEVIPRFSNLFNKNDVESGYRWYVNGNTVTKNAVSAEIYGVLTHNIKLKANTVYLTRGIQTSAQFTPQYDLNGNFAQGQNLITIESRGSGWIGKITVGNSDCYINPTVLTGSTDVGYISEYYDYYTDYGKIDYSPKCYELQKEVTTIHNSLTMYDKKVLIIGDSISVGRTSPIRYLGITNWVDVLCDIGFFNESTINNNSIHATGFVRDLSTQTDTDFNSRIRAVTSPETYDVVILFGGINDAMAQEVTLQAFKDGVDSFFGYVTENFINARFVIISPLHAFANWQESDQSDYTDYIKLVAKNYGLPILNATDESGWTPQITVFRNKWSIHINNDPTNPEHDGVHPITEYNQKFLAPYFKGFLKQFI